MKLYNVPRNSKIMLSNGVVLLFHHIDGMYSVCTDENGDIYHISASEEVTIGVPVGIGGFATTTSTPAQPVQDRLDNDFFKSLAKKNQSPDQRPWVGLTNKDIIEMWPQTSTVGWDDIRLIEAKLKEKNT